MSLWLVRAGSSGEWEGKFLNDKKIYLNWDNLRQDLSVLQSKSELAELLAVQYPGNPTARLRNWASQLWPFVKEMRIGDWVVLPSKLKGSIHIGKIVGDYTFAPDGEERFVHSRSVDWFATDIPRSNFDQDLLYSFGAFMTICRISRNDAEARVKAMANANFKSRPATSPQTALVADTLEAEGAATVDVERLSRDQIAKFLESKYKGHGMARIIEAILNAQGYVTHRSPEGPDKGVDLLAGSGALGFGSPRICVQVKTGDVPVDRPTLDQLIGAMQNFGAERGLLVSWGGFKSSVDREVAQQFFRVRLWDQDAVIEELLRHYDQIGDELKAELPLKRVWVLTQSEGE